MDADLIRDAKEALQASEEGWRQTRERSLEAYRAIAGDPDWHWPTDVRAIRESQQRPCLQVNKLPQFLAQVTGRYRLQNLSIQVVPADDRADVQAAKIYEGLIRAIQYESVAQTAYRNGLQCSGAGGFGYWRVAREYEEDDAWDQVVRLQPIYNPFSVYLDPRGFRSDLEDSAFVLITDEMPLHEFQAKWPKASTEDLPESLGDKKPKWTNDQDKTVRVAEYWQQKSYERTLIQVGYGPDDPDLQTLEWPKEQERQADLQGMLFAAGLQVLRDRKAKAKKITYSLVSGGDVLEKTTDWPGRYYPIVPVFGEELVFAGERHVWGVVANALDSQRIYNFQWSAAVEMVALQPKAPWVLTPRQLNDGKNDNTQYWQNANRSIPYLVFNPDPQYPGAPQRQPPPTVPTGMLELCDRASYDLRETTGIYQASLGEKSNEKSGAAIRARQEQGDVATATWPDNLRISMEHTGRILVDIVSKVYDNQRIVRILGEDLQTTELQRINFEGYPDLTTGKYDVIVRVGPAWSSRREESQQGMLEVLQLLAQADPQKAAAVLPIIVKYTDNPAAEELTEALHAVDQQRAQMAQALPSPEEVQIPEGMMQ